MNKDDNKFSTFIGNYFDQLKYQKLVLAAFAKGMKPPIELQEDELHEI